MAFLPTGELNCGKPQWSIPLTLRPSNMSDHAGQVSFPGGRCQRGETAQQAACREYSEELGCPSDSMELIGSMPSLYVYASRHQVVPVLSIGGEFPDIKPNVHEVEKVLWLPLEQLMQLKPQARTVQRNAIELQASGFWLEGHWVWGATAMMLGELKIRLERLA
jgi:8-oxo-dGTP pyrophosphatase MutT (NUDIX family)